jgi:hypothetical protein
VRIEYEGNDNRTRIVFENGDSEVLVVTPLGAGLYRLEESSFLGEVRYLDVIRATALDDRSLLFKELVPPSDLVTQTWVFSRETIASRELREILDRVMTIGGNWEQAFGGVLMVHVPKESMEAIEGQINGLR